MSKEELPQEITHKSCYRPGFLYFQFPTASPPSGEYHLIAKVKHSVTGEETAFDFPVNLTLSKK
jgi:hypothetical protein